LWKQNSAFFAELEPFFDQITLNDFTLNGLDIQLFLSLQEQLQADEKELLAKQTTKDHLTKQITEQTEQLLRQETEQKKLIADISSLETKIASVDTGKIEQLKQEKAELYLQQQQLEPTEIQLQQLIKGLSLITDSGLPLLGEMSADGATANGGGQRGLSTLSDLYTLIQTLKER
jgi:hypothetical protein